MRILSCASALAVAASLSLVGSAQAQVNEYIINGDFETGDFTGWLNNGWVANDGTLLFNGSGMLAPPIAGANEAATNPNGPGTRTMQQCFVIPNTTVSAIFSWCDRINNLAGTFADPNQEFRILLTDFTTGLPITEIFSTNPGDPPNQPVTPRSVDLTAVFQANPGACVCISIEEQDSLFFFEVGVDNVSLLVDSPDPVMLKGPSSVTDGGPACVPGPPAFSSIKFTPDGAGGYDTTVNGGSFDGGFAGGTPLGMGDDTTSVQALPFNFTMPGGTVVTDIEIDSNGRLFEVGTETSDFSPTVAELLGDGTSNISPLWDDLSPNIAGEVWVHVGAGGEFYVTWDNVPQFGTANSNTVQVCLEANGCITFNYPSVDATTGIIGVSAGNGAADPGASDLSAGPISSGGVSEIYEAFGGPNPLDFGAPQLLPVLSNSTQPIIGTSFDLSLANVATAMTEFYLIGNATSIDLNPFGIPCFIRTDSIFGTIGLLPGTGLPIAIPNLPALAGAQLTVQGATLDLTAGNPFFVLFSNDLTATIGFF